MCPPKTPQKAQPKNPWVKQGKRARVRVAWCLYSIPSPLSSSPFPKHTHIPRAHIVPKGSDSEQRLRTTDLVTQS